MSKMLETKIDIDKTALLLIDMQNDLIKSRGSCIETTKMAEVKGLIGKTARVVEAARKAGMPVIYTNHVHRRDGADVVPTITDHMLQGLETTTEEEEFVEGTPGADVVDELKPTPGEHVIWKHRSSGFYGSDLELMLRSRGIDTVIITGAVTNGCIVNTVRAARERDFHVIVLSDCCACDLWEDDEYFMTRVFPGAGRVRTAEEMETVISEAIREKDRVTSSTR
jgi:ureidoacrylate peracid hydrolase